ncbi:hypothetical protein Amsp01_056490 [Amycolatopsis sp. NBRC 101858]|nr:hypothetical protein Amsp01_056490 [Amycolatopsis sp. NBRC 101858]
MGGRSEAPMPIRSGAKRRPGTEGITLRHKYDDVGFPCKNTTGAPAPDST